MAQIPNKDLVERLDTILRLSKGKSVLHLGCTNYPYTKQSIDADMLLHSRLNEVAGKLMGLDNDEESLDLLRKEGFDSLYTGDLEELESLKLESSPEVIIAGEMIEHLNNPGAFLKGVKSLMTEKTELVITTINAYCALRFFQYGLRGKKGVNEPVHPDHVAYYSYSTLSLLLERHGFVIEEFYFYGVGKEHRPHNKFYWNLINDIAVALSPQLADGVIAVCRKGTDG